MERALKKAISYHEQFGLRFIIHPELERYLHLEGEKEALYSFAERQQAQLRIETSDHLHVNDFQLYSTVTGEALAI